MIDIHTHIIPEADDGSEDIEESLGMLKKGWERGISSVCATPHILKKVDYQLEQKILSGFELLKKRISEGNLGVEIFLGAEIHISQWTEDFRKSRYFTINNNQRYPLLELPLNHIPDYVEQVIFKLCLDGYFPVLAHPERSMIEETDLKRLEKIADLGALFQLNAGSLLGHFGKKVKKFSIKLLKNELVHFVASDAHNKELRSIEVLSEAFPVVSNLVGKSKAIELFHQNPENLLKGESIQSLCWDLGQVQILERSEDEKI